MSTKTPTNKKLLKVVVWLCLVIAASYGLGRLYFEVTGGFLPSNIASDFPNNPRWDTRPLAASEKQEVVAVLSQPYTYLGKGCQSYVFLSQDGQYVLKFLKYQRFRPQFYLEWFSPIPFVDNIRQEKIEKKRHKLDDLFSSWKIAFNELPKETGLVYVHLNKTKDLQATLTIYDKIGLKYELNIDDFEFLIQKRATMLCPQLDSMMAAGDVDGAKGLLSRLLQMIVSEYHRGLADNDHALMQNTGVQDGEPVHVDVGQFVYNEAMRDPNNYNQELFNKMYKFRLWLREKYPELLSYLDAELYKEMGDVFYKLKHIPKPHN